MVAKGEGGGGGLECEFGISRCKLFYIEWINNKVLLNSPGNRVQYPVINHNGKEKKMSWKRERVSDVWTLSSHGTEYRP